MIQKLLKQFSTVTLYLATGLFIAGCASLEDNLTGVPIASMSHYEKGKIVEKFYVNGRSAGFNDGGFNPAFSSITLEKDFRGPLTINIKWEVCNFKHNMGKKVKTEPFCIDEVYEASVPVHVLNSPNENAYLYLHFLKDNTAEAWMTNSDPESNNYPGPSFPGENYYHYD